MDYPRPIVGAALFHAALFRLAAETAFHFLRGTNSKWNSREKGAGRERPPVTRSNLRETN